MSDEQLLIEAARRGLLNDAPFEKRLDKNSGAPIGVRASVGAATKPEDRLSTLRKTYPDAQPYEDNNFTFTHPKTGRPTLYNPPGLDIGDVASAGPEIAEMGGGTLGASIAALLAPATAGASVAAVPAAYGLGAAGGREGYTALARLLQGTDDTRGLGERLSDTALTAGVNAVGARAGDLISRGISKITQPVTNVVRRGVQRGQALLDDFSNAGVTPTAGAITGNRGLQIMESGISNTPGGAGVMQRVGERQLEETASEADRLARMIAPEMTGQDVGTTLQAGAKAAAKRFETRQGEIYDKAFDLVGPRTKVQAPSVSGLVKQLESEIADAPASRGPVLKKALERAQAVFEDAGLHRDEAGRITGAGLPFETLRKIRTDLGKDLANPVLAGSTGAQAEAERKLYAALSADVEAAARSAGTEAEKALATADRYTRFHMNRTIPLLEKVAGSETPEKAFSYAMAGSKDGGTRLAALRRSVTPEEWDTVSGTVLGRLGRSAPANQGATPVGEDVGTFSVNTFITNFNKLSPEAQSALWGGTRYAALRPEINRLIRVAESLKNADRMANPSGTARNLMAGMGIFAATQQVYEGDPVGGAKVAAATVLVPKTAAKLITNPSFVRWLGNAAATTARNPNALPAELGRLAAIAEAEPDIRNEIQQYWSAVTQSTGE